MFVTIFFKQMDSLQQRQYEQLGDLLVIIKIILVGCLIFMIYNLFKALLVMNRNDPNKASMAKFIGRRVMISAFIVILMLVGIMTGVITPNPRPF